MTGAADGELALLTRLQQATAELAGALTVEDAVTTVTGSAVATLGDGHAAVGLVDGVRLTWRAESGPLTVAPITLERLPATPSYDDAIGALLPLRAAGEVLGVLWCRCQPPRQLSAAERTFLEALAGQCALAITRAQLIARERAGALALQRALLPPRLPDLPWIELAARYLPAVRDTSVGGDWYDAIVLPDGRLSLSVGDVMGKGLVAAAGMGRMRSALRALAVTDPDPAHVLGSLDRLFAATESGDQELLLTTVVVMLVDPGTGAVRTSDAGHLPIVRVTADGDAELLDVGPGTTPLGLPEPRDAFDLMLAAGDTLLAFTDGLVEERDESLDVGLEQVRAAASGSAGSSLETLLDTVLAARLGVGGGADDVTLLGVRLREQPPDLRR